MKWRPISELDTEDDVLFRIEMDTGKVFFVVGYICDNSLILHGDGFLNEDYGFFCLVSNIDKHGIKDIMFVNPKEIEL